jgi:hypothetical protein
MVIVASAVPGWVLVLNPHRGLVTLALFILTGISASLPLCVYADAQGENTRVDIQFENWQMSLLAQAQQRAGVSIKPFSTDGCSGGLSFGWQNIADRYPSFAEKFGDHPPWEACCVEHDRAYWRGETQDGYAQRLNADNNLKQCVLEFAKTHSQMYADQFGLDKASIETQLSITANMMYAAVRLGGKPCSFLPWRWGYGWPHCFALSADHDE